MERDSSSTIKVAIIGSRGFNNYSLLREKMFQVFRLADIEEIISGGAIGADSLASKFAKEMDIPFREYTPDYGLSGKKAPILRNLEIAQHCDTLVAFWDGASKGTNFTIKQAHRLNKEVLVFKI